MNTEALPNDIPNNCNIASESVLNGIQNDCDMATELAPKEIKNHHRAYRKVYCMASRDDPRDLTATDITPEGLHMEIE